MTRSYGFSASVIGALLQIGIIVALEPLDWNPCRSADCAVIGDGDLPYLYLLRPWAPHIENLGEGRPAFLGPRCPGRQQSGTPFRIAAAPLPAAYDPDAFPDSDVIACVRLDPGGGVERVQIAGGTGRAALDRRLLQSLFRQWRFVPADDVAIASGWQRVRLNSAYRRTSPPEPWPDTPLPV